MTSIDETYRRFTVIFRPPIPTPADPTASREELLELLRTRLVDAAHADGNGLAMSIPSIRKEVNIFSERVLDDKSIEQLRRIEAIPRVVIDLEYVKSTGLISRAVSDESCVIYYKHISAPRAKIVELAKQTSGNFYLKRTDLIATETLRHVPEDTDAHIHFLHIGRYTAGLKSRRQRELLDETAKQKNPEKVLRAWVEVVHRSDRGPNGIGFWLLSDLSEVTGYERSRRLVSGWRLGEM